MNLADHFLVAMPDMDDPFFDGSVVYICEHSGGGALGLIINKPSPVMMDLIFTASDRNIPLRFQDESVMMGRPVCVDHDYVVHTPIGNWQGSVTVTEDVVLTSPRNIIENLADPKKVVKALISIGYSSWGEGQLEQELTDNVWLTVPVDKGILFDVPYENRYSAVLAKLGTEPASLICGAEYA